MSVSDSSDDRDVSPDSEERVQDFWARHGGPGPREGAETVPGLSGWTEVHAADGYVLRCEWSRVGSEHSMQYTEKPPRA